MKLITFSLWGQDPKYLTGAIKNAELASEIYPGWICRFYVGKSVPATIISKLSTFPHVQIVTKNAWGDWKGMYWRFEPASEEDVEVMISRDTDSRLNHREKAAVDEWLESDKGFHIMRDHPFHKFPVLGGMWGVKKDVVPNMVDMIKEFGGTDEYGTDYAFFAKKVLPSIHRDQVLIHDEFFGGEKFPTPRVDFGFVGQVYDANDNTVEEHVRALKDSIRKEIYIHHHLGLGDHIDCNGMIRSILKTSKFTKACVFTKSKYYDLIDYMYRDDDNIELIKVSNDKEHEDVNKYSAENDVPVLRVGHENYPWGKEEELGKGCAELFYDQIGMSYDIRFDEFYYERDEKEETRLCQKLNPDNKPYVFVHDDADRGFEIKDSEIRKLAGEDIHIIRNDMSENIFYYGKLFENAKQIHCMESCFRSLIETLDIKGDLFFHNFREGASGYLGNSTRQPWKEITS